MADDGPAPTLLEIASCTAAGHTARVEAAGPVLSPLAALEAAVLPALARPPCVISFSGGMDSTFVLFVAVRAARAAGLPAPIPVTWRFTGAPRAEESGVQHEVMAMMPNLDWQLLHADDDLDLIGPVAQRVLTRHGVLLPPNIHLHLPIVELAAGGSLVTGAGGDQVLAGRPPPGGSARLRAHAPGGLVAAVRQRQGRDPYPWLRPAASRAVVRGQRRDRRREPRTLDQRIAWHARQRGLLMTRTSLNTIAAPSDVRVVNPLLDPGFLTALTSATKRNRTKTPRLVRADLLRLIAGDAFPTVATDPRPKAHFLEVFLRTPSREFVQSWDGHGSDDGVIDARTLRRLWSQWPVPAATSGLVQYLWLATNNAANDRSGSR